MVYPLFFSFLRREAQTSTRPYSQLDFEANHATYDVYSPKVVETIHGQCYGYCFLYCV